MKYLDEDARRILSELRGSCTGSYADLIWALRCPGPQPKSSNGWPFRPASEIPVKAIRVVR